MKQLLLFMTLGLYVMACQHSHEHTHDESEVMEELYDYDVEEKMEELGIQLIEVSPSGSQLRKCSPHG